MFVAIGYCIGQSFLMKITLLQLTQCFYSVAIILMLNITDQQIWEASKILYQTFEAQDREKRLNQEDLSDFKQKMIKPLYPHRISSEGNIQKYGCCESCCSFNPGRFCCCNSLPPESQFQQLGVGMCLYFKFLKHSSTIFILIAILAIVSCLICLISAAGNGFQLNKDSQTLLFGTTLGAFSSERLKCLYQKVPNPISLITFNIQCSKGTINLIGATFSKQSLNNLYNCKNQIITFLDGQSQRKITAPIVETCSSPSNCQVKFTPASIPNGYTTIAFSYECLDVSYGVGNKIIQSRFLLYIVVGMDLFFCMILTLFYCSEQIAQKQQIDYFEQQQLSLNDYTIKIKGFNLSSFQGQFNSLVMSLRNSLGDDCIRDMVQVKTPDPSVLVQFHNNQIQAYQNLYQFISQKFFELEANPNTFKSHQQFMSQCFQQGKYEKYKTQLRELLDSFYSLNYDPQLQNKSKTCSALLSFNSIPMKKKVLELQQKGCCSESFQLSGKSYTMSEPPAPDMIIWANKGKWTFIRVFISWMITLLICFGSYMLFGYLQYQQNYYLSQYNFNIDCDVLFVPANFNTYNVPVGVEQDVYLSCFCSTHILQLDWSQCTEWRKSYFIYVAIPTIISLFLVIYNVVVTGLFRFLSKFQSHRLIASELYSYTLKRAFLLIMNSALIMIILNMKYSGGTAPSEVGFLLQGRYGDFTADWYSNIGSVIILTMVFNITFPVIQLILTSLLQCLRKCWDRRCKRATSCKTKQQYSALYSGDIYPIQERYAFLLSLILVTLAFSSVIPLLIVICALSLLLLYFADRVLIFKVYQTPTNYGPNLHKVIGQVFFLGLIIHFALAAYFLSQPQMVAPGSTFETVTLSFANPRMKKMISTVYIVPYVVLTVLFIVWFFLKNTIIAFCGKISNGCKSSQNEVVESKKLKQTYFDSISPYQLSRLKIVTESQIDKLFNLENRKNAMNKKGQLNETIQDLNISQIQLTTSEKSQHQLLLRRTLAQIQTEEKLRKLQLSSELKLIGSSSYEVFVSDQAFERNKKINNLRITLSHLQN